ncbi:MAG TPA: c-type cytochrome [Candidatus Limnocylindria bacterium]
MTVHTPISTRGRGIPAWAAGLTVLVLLVGGVYLAGNLTGENPPIIAEPSASGGQTLEQAARQIIEGAQPSCTACHGTDLTGGAGPSLHGIANGPKSENLQQLASDHPDDWPNLWIAGTDPAVADIDRLGMPQFGTTLTEEQIATVVEYLKTLP